MQDETRGAFSAFREKMENLLKDSISTGKLKPEQAETIFNKTPEMLVDETYKSLETDRTKNLQEIISDEDGFVERNYERWKEGFDLLRMFRHICLGAGHLFQQEFLKYPQFKEDVLLGVLMRLHARACRVTGEVIALLINGYPDGALSRWRTLHEIAVISIVLKKYGQAAAEDYIRYARVQVVNGMERYQKTAQAMGREPYSLEEIEKAREWRSKILASDKAFESTNGWARKYVGASKFEKLQIAVGLEKWDSDYASASLDIHSAYREMRSLLGMAEAKEEILLSGPSNSGMTEPAHFTAIALSQITATFILTYSEDEECPIDHTGSAIFTQLINRFVHEIGAAFLAVDEKRPQ